LLNVIWPLFIIISFVFAIVFGDISSLNNSIFDSTEQAIELSISLLGTICLWSGIMRIAEETNLVDRFARALRPCLKWLFPDITNSKILREISMNIVANILGLGNAATPLGLKAMKSMQDENPKKDVLTDSMATFIVLNTASIQIIPTTVIAIRSSMGSRESYSYSCSCLDCNNLCCCGWNFCY
jgi:spore maturation protein A